MKPYLVFGVFWYVYQHGKVTANQIAEHFEISTRTVYRYVEAITYSGIPMCAEKGCKGGIYLPSWFNVEKMQAYCGDSWYNHKK